MKYPSWVFLSWNTTQRSPLYICMYEEYLQRLDVFYELKMVQAKISQEKKALYDISPLEDLLEKASHILRNF